MDNRLTQRELEILKLIEEGENNDKIAEKLDISVNTVKAHVGSIFTKLGVENRVQAAIKALREKIVEDK